MCVFQQSKQVFAYVSVPPNNLLAPVSRSVHMLRVRAKWNCVFSLCLCVAQLHTKMSMETDYAEEVCKSFPVG